MNQDEKEIVQAKMKSVLKMGAEQRESYIAQTIGDVYDPELPIPDVVDAISDVRRAEPGEHVFFLVPEDIVKEVFTLTSNCTVIQEKVQPSTRNELSFTDIISKEYFVCIHDWIKGDHDVIRFFADAIMEAMNRQEDFAVIALLNAGATASGNLFTLSTGKSAFDYPKLIEMRKALRKFGRRFVLISGCNVSQDIDLMDFNADTQREFGIDKVVDEWIPIEDYEVEIDGTPTKVIGVDEAYLIAMSDSKGRRPVLFSRRKLDPIADASDTTIVAKERAVIDTGNMIKVNTARKFARGKAGFEEFGAVLLNNNVVAKFNRV